MRIVLEFRELRGSTVNMGKHMRLRVRQVNFKAMIVTVTNDEIMILDYQDKDLDNKTLKEMAMGIKSLNIYNPGNLYHAIGKDWRGRYMFISLKSKENEARMLADRIIPYLKHVYGGKVTNLFLPRGSSRDSRLEMGC